MNGDHDHFDVTLALEDEKFEYTMGKPSRIARLSCQRSSLGVVGQMKYLLGEKMTKLGVKFIDKFETIWSCSANCIFV